MREIERERPGSRHIVLQHGFAVAVGSELQCNGVDPDIARQHRSCKRARGQVTQPVALEVEALFPRALIVSEQRTVARKQAGIAYLRDKDEPEIDHAGFERKMRRTGQLRYSSSTRLP